MYVRLQPRHCLDTIAINAPALDPVGLRTGDKVEFNIVDLDFVDGLSPARLCRTVVE